MIYTIHKENSLIDVVFNCYNEINNIYENYLIDSYRYLYESDSENESTEKKNLFRRIIEAIKGVFKAIGRTIGKIISILTGKNKNRKKDEEKKVEELKEAIKEKENKEKAEDHQDEEKPHENPRTKVVKLSFYPRENFTKLEKEMDKLSTIFENLGKEDIDEKLKNIDSDINSYPMTETEDRLWRFLTVTLFNRTEEYSEHFSDIYWKIKEYCEDIVRSKSVKSASSEDDLNMRKLDEINKELDDLLGDIGVDASTTSSNVNIEEIEKIPKLVKENAQKVLNMANKLYAIREKMSDYNHNLYLKCVDEANKMILS